MVADAGDVEKNYGEAHCRRCGAEKDPERESGLCQDCDDLLEAREQEHGKPVDAKEYLPEWMGDPATKTHRGVLWVLCVSGRCRCGETRWFVAPDWKVPAEWGGGYMTDTCPGCLGTMEYSEEWERVDHLVDEYRELHPENLSPEVAVDAE